MFTILNIINYFTGKYIPVYLLILISIGIYFYIIRNYLQYLIIDNLVYFIILLIIMLVDITSLIIIFSSDNFNYSNSTGNNQSKKIISIEKKK